MNNSNITPMQSFEEKIKDKLTKDIGDLIPDDALKALIEKATHSVFFEDRKEYLGTGYNQRTSYKDSVFKEVVKDLLKDRVDVLIREWMDENRELMAEKLKDFINTNAKDAVISAMFGSIIQHFDLMKSNIQMDLTDKLNGY